MRFGIEDAAGPGPSAVVPAARAMPSTTGLTNSRWLGIGRHRDDQSTALDASRRAPAWYFTSPAQPSRPQPRALLHRILELGEDLRVRLLQHVRQHVQPAAMRHADEHVGDAGLGGVDDHLVEHRDEHVEPLDREPRLARERAVQEPLEGFDLGEPIEQRRASMAMAGGRNCPDSAA